MFVAQCLEHDVAVQAADIDILQRRFEETFAHEVSLGDLEAIGPAPEEFHAKWNEAKELESSVQNAEMRLAA